MTSEDSTKLWSVFRFSSEDESFSLDRRLELLRPLREGEVRRRARAHEDVAPSPSESATKTLATRMSVPRIEVRQRESADRTRRTVNRPVSEYRPPPAGRACRPVTGRSCAAAGAEGRNRPSAPLTASAASRAHRRPDQHGAEPQVEEAVRRHRIRSTGPP